MSDQAYLDQLRHSTAHLLAAAVLELWPDAKPTIGPAIENGFYYDFEFSQPISDQDLQKIELKMRQIVKTWESFERFEISPDQAAAEFAYNHYKLELISDLAKEGGELTVYQSGEFRDLCRGGHVDHPKTELKHFKLMNLAGAYWRGDSQNQMLTRIYGTAFPTKEELQDYLINLEEAKKRDHKILGPKFDLFTFSPLVGTGLPLWTPKGTLLRSILDDFVWELRQARGYHKVEIPHITKKELYETSGHWDKFKDELFKIDTREGHQFAMKPMNCPHHTQIFARKPHSYREMPQRYANTTMVYRDEQTGELSGLSRVRAITQDDAHVFCTKDQIKTEMLKIWDIIDEFYSAAGFDLTVRLSLSDPNKPEQYLGTRKDWQEAEAILRQIATERGQDVTEAPGEAAFYGPKLDFMAKDSLGRQWQVGTNQLDMNMPKRFGLYYINQAGQKDDVYMLHAAIMGSIERYLSILIEHFSGAFPLWLSPVQLVVIPITSDQIVYAKLTSEQLQAAGFRAELWDEPTSMQKKIRTAEKSKIPYMLILGDQEVKQETVTVRTRGIKEQITVPLAEFLSKIKPIAAKKQLAL
jgi:threonyl-tRNA synthetase